jgi:hypothetical protein
MITGGCLCGGVRYQVGGQPASMYYCHCSQCRRATGSAFAANVMVRSDDLSFVAGEELLASYESSPGKRRHFCSRCGSPIYSRSQAMPQLSSLRSGTLDGDPGIRPGTHIHVASKADWFEIHDTLPRKPRGALDP